MNYVLYVLGTLAIVFGRLDVVFFHIIGFILRSDFANAIVGPGSGVLVLWGILVCAFGSVIGLLKQIAQHTRGNS